MADQLAEFDFGDHVETAVFEQILDMDDEEEGDHEFSKSIVFGFLEQAESTFVKMDEALKDKELDELSSLGHFLKGSSATLGFNKIKDECEKIQHYGHQMDETGTTPEPDKEKCLRLIEISMSIVKHEYKKVATLMKEYYAQLEKV